MGTRGTILAGLLVGVMLAGCSSDATGEAAAPASSSPAASPAVTTVPATTTTAPPTTTGSSKSARGNLVKAIGQEGGTTAADGTDLWTFTVNAITVGADCRGGSPDPPKNGNFLVVQITFTTSATYNPSDDLGFVPFSPFEMAVVDQAGLTTSSVTSDAALNCELPGDSAPLGLSASSTYKFHTIVDSPTPSGTLIYKPNSLNGLGWEFAFPG